MKAQNLDPTQPQNYLALGLFFSLSMVATPVAQAQDLDPNATEVLQFMSDYLAEIEAFSVNADIDFEIVAQTGQKLQFSSYANVLVLAGRKTPTLKE
jgi:hypothetical protein